MISIISEYRNNLKWLIKMDLKIIGLSALVNAVITIPLSLIYFPLSFLGPFCGGFLASYLSKGYEDYYKMDERDGMVVGAISGLIGGLIIIIFFIVGIGDISPVIGFISNNIGEIGNNIIVKGYIILQFSVVMSFIFGLIGGIIGVKIKK